MNITKTEVLKAISACEKFAGFASIDNALVSPGAITRGDLFTLIEAAKCAEYKDAYTSMESRTGISTSHLVLTDA